MTEIPKFGEVKVEAAPAPEQRKKRKYTRRKGVEKGKTKPEVEREFAFFLDEDNGLQICRADGEGEPLTLQACDAIAVAAFVERHRGAFT